MKKTLWKIYFWLLLITTVPTYLWQGFSRIWEVIDAIAMLVAMLGLLAFCWQKRLLSVIFWRIFFIIYIIWNIFQQYILPWPQTVQEAMGDLSQSVAATINIITFIPLMIALYLYAFKNAEAKSNQPLIMSFIPHPAQKILAIAIAFIILLQLNQIFLILGLTPSEEGASLSEDYYASTCSVTANVSTVMITGTLATLYFERFDEYGAMEQVTSSRDIVMQLRNLSQNSAVEAIVVEIESYGGMGIAGKEIADELRRIEKPTVALIRGVGASAAYRAATGADYIIASPSSDVGSIGVTMSYLEHAEKNIEEGLVYRQISAGKYKDAGDPDRPLSEEERNIFQHDLQKFHNAFIEDVAAYRDLPVEQVRTFSNGLSFTGADALEKGLIDELGDFVTAEEYLTKRLGHKADVCW